MDTITSSENQRGKTHHITHIKQDLLTKVQSKSFQAREPSIYFFKLPYFIILE